MVVGSYVGKSSEQLEKMRALCPWMDPVELQVGGHISPISPLYLPYISPRSPSRAAGGRARRGRHGVGGGGGALVRVRVRVSVSLTLGLGLGLA